MLPSSVPPILLLLLLAAVPATPLAGQRPAERQPSEQKPTAQEPGEQQDEAGRHLNHIMSGWEEAPSGQGLLALAVAETQVASRHATLAVRNSDNLEAMKSHARHVLHALDPTLVEEGGPGLGYGIVRVCEDIADHIQLAVEAEGFGGNIANHAPAVIQSADNAAGWAREMIDVAQRIQAAETAEAAEPLAIRLRTLATRVVSGADLNDDDEVRWQDGEGGIMHIQEHMNLLIRVDGRWYLERQETNSGSGSPNGRGQ